MQVTHVNDHVTHALIGGGKTVDFGISSSAEFFHILSSTLYTNQKLAVVRETICNAWDAHIEAGITDKPITITLDRNHLVIRDYGHGIADDDMGPIYGTYGGSTKKANGEVTGGFGLGCKAPFAYTDHFEVTSHHQGRKTIYNLSKSSAEVEGKPGITPIASFPTDEQGLQVKIPLSNSRDADQFDILIRMIVAYGDISANLNDQPLPRMSFTDLPENFVIGDFYPIKQALGGNTNIFIRYGNVVYPTVRHEDYGHLFDKISDILRNLAGNSYSRPDIAFQAPPNSISVTPSRESLSMQEHTIKTISGLLSGFLDSFKARFDAVAIDTSKKTVAKLIDDKIPEKLFNPDFVPVTLGLFRSEKKKLTGYDEVIKNHICVSPPTHVPWFRTKETIYILDKLIEAGVGNTNLIRSFRSEYIRLIRQKRRKSLSNWLHRKVIFPTIQAINGDPELSAAHLFTYKKVAYHRNSNFECETAKKATKRGLKDYIPFLQNIIVLVHNQIDITDRLPYHPDMVGSVRNMAGFLVYRVPRNAKKIAAARQFFEKSELHLIDLTKPMDGETVADIQPLPKPSTGPKRKGLPSLRGLMDDRGTIQLGRFTDKERRSKIPYIEKPKIVVTLSANKSMSQFPNMTRAMTATVISLFGDDIAVARNAPQEDHFVRAGAVRLNDHVIARLCSEIKSNKNIHKFRKYDLNSTTESLHWHWALPVFLLQDEELSKHYGVNIPLNDQDKLYVDLFHSAKNNYDFKHNNDLKKAIEVYNSIKTSPKVAKLLKAIEDNYMLRFLDLSNMHSVWQVARTKGDEESLTKLSQIRKLIKTAIKG